MGRWNDRVFRANGYPSVQLLISEMGELLKGASLEKIRYKFSDYAMFNQQRKGSLKWHQDRMYWLERLKKLPEAPILPQDGRAADKCENTYEFYRFQKHINQSDWKRIKEIAGEYGVTVSSVLIGIYAEVISRWSSNKHFTLNLPIQNRPTIGNNTNSIVGDFTAVNLLEVNVTQNMSFIERVKEITKRLMEDLEHNSFSGVEVLRELSKVSEEKELLMPIVFTGVLKTDGTVGTIEYGFSHTPQVWIDCQIVDEIDSEDQEKGLMISWDTRKGAIKESIVTEMFESFTETIRILGIKHSEEWKNPLEIIVPSASKKKVICERNKGITNQSRIQQRFVKYAKKNSNKTAVIDAVETVTYGELLERAEYIAGYLRKEFVENRTGLVAIRMKKSVNQIAAVMGVLIAGFSYLPIDIKQPLARQEKILSKANVIVELDEKKVNMILQNLEYRLEKHPEFQNPIAYVIFTSGSTGEPKGVVMSHTAAQNTLICAIHVLYDGIDILGCALGGLSTWKLGNVAESYTTSMAGGGNRVISGIIGMVPVTFIVNTNVDRNDIDHPLHLYHRIELTFSTGRLCLVNTHGPVIWLPFLHMPRDEYGTLSINVEEEVNIPSGVTIGNVMLPSVKETFEQIWPDAVKKALEILFKQNRTEKMSMAQYQIYVSKLWSEICQKVGYMNIVDYDNFGDIKNIFYDLEKRHLIKKENDGIE
ncbi:MAG: AMP-binding protein [Mediterraneibacter faecis]